MIASLCPEVRTERGAGHLHQRIFPTLGSQLDEGAAERLAVRPVDERTLVPAEGADPVTRTQEGKVAGHHVIEQRGQVGLDPPLRRRFGLIGITGGERAAAQDDAGPVVEIHPTKRRLFQPDPTQVPLVEAAEAEHRRVLLLGGDVFRPNGQEEEGFHGPTLRAVERSQPSGSSIPSSAMYLVTLGMPLTKAGSAATAVLKCFAAEMGVQCRLVGVALDHRERIRVRDGLLEVVFENAGFRRYWPGPRRWRPRGNRRDRRAGWAERVNDDHGGSPRDSSDRRYSTFVAYELIETLTEVVVAARVLSGSRRFGVAGCGSG